MEIGWTEIFNSDSLTLRCEVLGISAEWNYTWYRDGEQIPRDHPGETLTVRSGNGSYQSEYKCRGIQSEHPTQSKISEGILLADEFYRAVENLVRMFFSVAVLIFLSVIVSDAFLRRMRRIKMSCRAPGEERDQTSQLNTS
ncbi:hypothetical protein JZ751_003698 [Albula glossodonta]|uniref:Ig-like domain-containing protein n=1 Tax=Albula glossodonta TaxID=121402 RepID=A0A8T2N5X4_9TELE|nr:hypothetical protein JZ751_003698 [Albula glossodonta]